MGRGADITWKSLDEHGEKREVYAERVNQEWRFFARPGRYDNWEPLADPSLDDWLELLDGVRRRVQRRWFPPEVESRLEVTIREKFPDAELDR